MGFFDFLKLKKRESLYSGGDGSSKETAVVINATNMLVGMAAEYKFIEKQCGRRNTDWQRDLQMVLRSDDKRLDLIVVKLKNGDKKSFYFDITKFYGKF